MAATNFHDEYTVALLSTVTVSMGGNATIYVTPTGKTLVPNAIIVRSCASGMALANNYNFGSLPSALGFVEGVSLIGLATTSYYQSIRNSNATIYFNVPAGTGFGMANISGATGVTAMMDLFGYLF